MQPHNRSHAEEHWRGDDQHALKHQSQPQQDFDLDRKHHRLLLWLASTSASTNCMDDSSSYRPLDDHNRHSTGTYETRQYLPEPQALDVRTASRTRQILPGRRADIPLAYPPANWQDRIEVNPDVQQPVLERARGQRRRSDAPRNVASRHDDQLQDFAHVDPSFLYPHAIPYRDSHSIHNAPNAHERRSQNTSRKPTPLEISYDSDSEDSLDFSPAQAVPWYPPFEATSTRNNINYLEDAISNEDVHLFAQATAGLGPDIGLQGFQPSPALPHRNFAPATLYPQHSALAPPSRHAFQQFAPIPQEHAARRPQLSRLRTEPAALPNSNAWLSSPSPLIEDHHCSAVDEQLPGYAESQAQAQAVQATAARRRAQELQRRWQQSHG